MALNNGVFAVWQVALSTVSGIPGWISKPNQWVFLVIITLLPL